MCYVYRFSETEKINATDCIKEMNNSELFQEVFHYLAMTLNKSLSIKTSCDIGKHFGKLRDISVKIRHYIKRIRMPSGKRLVLSVSGRHLTTANRMHPVFSGRHSKNFDNFRSSPIFSDFLWRLPKTIRPMLY